MKLVSLCLLVGLVSAVVCDSSLVIKSADRTIDVTSQLVKITHRLTLSNTGKSAVSSFDFTICPKSQQHLSYFKAQVRDNYFSFNLAFKLMIGLSFSVPPQPQLADSKESSEGLKTTFSTNKDGMMTCKISLHVEAGQTAKVLIGSVFTHSLAPHPAEITQKEKQLVQYRGSAYIYSPYKITTQTTKILLSSSNVESFTKVKPSTQSDSTITYGPYENIAPFTGVRLDAWCLLFSIKK